MGENFFIDFSFFAHGFFKEIFENLFHKWGTPWRYTKLTTRAKSKKLIVGGNMASFGLALTVILL